MSAFNANKKGNVNELKSIKYKVFKRVAIFLIRYMCADALGFQKMVLDPWDLEL